MQFDSKKRIEIDEKAQDLSSRQMFEAGLHYTAAACSSVFMNGKSLRNFAEFS